MIYKYITYLVSLYRAFFFFFFFFMWLLMCGSARELHDCRGGPPETSFLSTYLEHFFFIYMNLYLSPIPHLQLNLNTVRL